MHLTIVTDDSIVLIDGKYHQVDCSSVDSSIHAVQWYGDHGDIEFKTIDGERAPNKAITDIAKFQTVIDLWTIADQKLDNGQ